MEIAKDARSYANYQNAGFTLDRALRGAGLDRTMVRWFIVARADARFVPAVMLTEAVRPYMLSFVSAGVSVVN
jgi:hypothetical protein